MYPGERICQIVFEKLDQPVPDGYQGRYSKKKGTKTAASYVKEANNKEIQLIRSGKVLEIKSKFAAKI
jgi:deoxycytidine triphosphate deaminase